MTSAAIEIELGGNDRQVTDMLTRVESAFSAEGIEEWLTTSVGPYLRERTEDRFKNEGDDVSGKWAPLLPSTMLVRSYIADQYGIAPDHPINRRTGDLQDFMTSGIGVFSALDGGGILSFPGKNARGEMKDKIQTAQRGKQFPRTVPRPVLGLGEKDLMFVVMSLSFHIAGRVRGGLV